MAQYEIQTAFAAGELSPNLYARVDLAKFEIGAALLRNFFVDFRGGVSNRPGTKFLTVVSDGLFSTSPARLIPFIVSAEVGYVLVFKNLSVDVYQGGVFLATIADTPWVGADLMALKYTQSADVLTVVHPSYAPGNITFDGTTWSFAFIVVGPVIQPPTITDMRAPHSDDYWYGYRVTSVDSDGKEESLPSNIGAMISLVQDETQNQVVGINWTAPAQAVLHYNVYKWGPVDRETMVPSTAWGFIGTSRSTTFTDANIAPDFTKQPPVWGDPFSGGQIQTVNVDSGGTGYVGDGTWPNIPYVPLTITGGGGSDAAGYAIVDNANHDLAGAWLDVAGKNYTSSPTITANGASGTGATFTAVLADPEPIYPSCTAYAQQRRCFAGSNSKPETIVMSQIGLYNNFNTTPTALDTDAIIISLAGEQVNQVKAMVPVSYGLLTLTTGGCYLINGGSPYAALTPTNVSVQNQTAVGANDLVPLKVGVDILYGQNKGNRIRNLQFAWQRQAFQGADISALAAHLFDTYETTDWTYAEEPWKIIWTVRSDGKLLSLTYVPDQEVSAWARHDTNGRFVGVCSVPEQDTNAVYFLIERYVPANGGWAVYFERLQERLTCCLYEAWYLDAAVGSDAINTQPNMTLFPSAATGTITFTIA